jgi:hypothetical protein
MRTDNKFQGNRYELKYLVDETRAQSVREYVRSFLAVDEFSNGDMGYPVHSLYFDAPHMSLYHDTVEGKKNRFKMRIRYYDDRSDSPAFLEIKRRTTDAIKKARATISRAGVDEILGGNRPDPSSLMSGSEKSLTALRQFCDLRDRLDARPQTFVCYWREAFASVADNHLRVTFDRSVCGFRYRAGDGLLVPKQEGPPTIDQVVLELKFTNRFPTWMRDLVQIFDLQRCSVPKYVECVNAVGMKNGNGRVPVVNPEAMP